MSNADKTAQMKILWCISFRIPSFHQRNQRKEKKVWKPLESQVQAPEEIGKELRPW